MIDELPSHSLAAESSEVRTQCVTEVGRPIKRSFAVRDHLALNNENIEQRNIENCHQACYKLQEERGDAFIA